MLYEKKFKNSLKSRLGFYLRRKQNLGFYLRRRQARGFTLLELLVVFSVIGILTGIGFASFVSYSKKQSIDQTAQDLKTAIDEARFSAVSRVKPSGCGTNTLDRYQVIPCANGGSNVCNTPSDLYQLAAICISGVTEQVVAQPAKKRPQNIIVNLNPAECGTYGGINYYALKNGFSPISGCRVVITTTDTTMARTLCIDAGGNASIKEGTSATPPTCP